MRKSGARSGGVQSRARAQRADEEGVKRERGRGEDRSGGEGGRE